jgi:hypothetical protein
MVILALCVISVLCVAQPAVADVVTFARGWDAGYAPAVALNGAVNTGIVGGEIVAYLGDSTYFDGSPHRVCRPGPCVMTLRLSYQLHCTSTPDGPVIDERMRNVKHRLVTYGNGRESGQVYVIHGMPSGFACTLSFADRVAGDRNDPTQWKRLRIELRLRTPTVP